MDMEQFIDSFLQFESEYEMFKAEAGGVKIWHFIRFNLFYDLVEKLEIDTFFEEGKKQKSNTPKKVWKDFFREKIVCNQFLAQKRDVLILPNGQKFKDDDGYYRCLYTDLLDRYILKPHYLLDGRSAEGIYAKQRSKNVLYIDYEMFKKVKRGKKVYKNVNKIEMERNIIFPIEKYYAIKIEVKWKKKWFGYINYILNKKNDYINYFNYMLHKIAPKVIILTCHYSIENMCLCEVAKKKKIPVIELQHGGMGSLHIAYNFWRRMELPGFPDYIFTFGQLDKLKTRFPIDNERIIATGYPELESNCNKYHIKNNLSKKRKVILFVSQGIVEIAKYVESVADMLDAANYRIIFKLHPKEYNEKKNIYGKYLMHSNIEVCGGYNKTIYEFLAEADWVIGCYSTVLYEATMFEAKIAVIKTSRYKSMKDIYENGYAMLVDSPQRLAQEIIEDTFIKNSSLNIFEKNSIKNMLNSIDEIMGDK